MSESTYTADVDVRFRDLDTMNHVNNAVYVTYVEQARIEYVNEVMGQDLDTLGMVVAALEVEYRNSIVWGQDVTVGVQIPELGGSSFPMEYEIYADGDLAATAETIQVAVDEETGESHPIPSNWRERIASYEGL